ncbi:MAG: SDR family oxidoreductase [bacterium]|jgi:nucleoside-diphosphate-sugar epimerase|nr:SDR family oxidoreductase [bacterium]
MAHYLVTGGAGFIGSSIAIELVRRGETVRIIDNLATGRKQNIENILDRVEFVEGDICDLETIRRAASGVDYVLHQAAIPSVARSVEDPVTTNSANVTGTLNVLLAARDARVKRLVFASSSSIYGDSPTLPKEESMCPNPLSPYAASKLIGEYYCKIFQSLFGLETICLRYFNVFGPRQDPTSHYAAVVPIFITSLASGRQPTVYGDGLQSRDFTFVENVIEANLRACAAPKEATGQVYNVACGERFTLLDLLREIGKILNKKPQPVLEPARPGDVKHSLADISRARESLSFEPRVSFPEGLRRTVEWFT